MKVGIVTASASRAGGGLFEAVRELAAAVKVEGCEVRVFAGSDEFTGLDRPSWGDTALKSFPVVGPHSFGYQRGLLSSLRDENPDLVHLHGLWKYTSLATVLWSGRTRPRVISPHGMLDRWALQNSPAKKRVAFHLYENWNIMGAACLHALTDAERGDFRALGYKGPIAVIPNGVNLARSEDATADAEWLMSIPQNSRILLYLGRLHPKKGLPILLRSFGSLSASGCLGNLHLVIAGWDQGGHLSELRLIADQLKISSRVHFVGPQFGAAKCATFASAHAFILPSLSEGLPMAVLEAWAFRLPALITPACNLAEALSVGAAIEILPQEDSISSGLLRLNRMSDEDLYSMGCAGRRYAESEFSWETISKDMNKLYEWAVGGGSPPSFVELA